MSTVSIERVKSPDRTPGPMNTMGTLRSSGLVVPCVVEVASSDQM